MTDKILQNITNVFGIAPPRCLSFLFAIWWWCTENIYISVKRDANYILITNSSGYLLETIDVMLCNPTSVYNIAPPRPPCELYTTSFRLVILHKNIYIRQSGSQIICKKRCGLPPRSYWRNATKRYRYVYHRPASPPVWTIHQYFPANIHIAHISFISGHSGLHIICYLIVRDNSKIR